MPEACANLDELEVRVNLTIDKIYTLIYNTNI